MRARYALNRCVQLRTTSVTLRWFSDVFTAVYVTFWRRGLIAPMETSPHTEDAYVWRAMSGGWTQVKGNLKLWRVQVLLSSVLTSTKVTGKWLASRYVCFSLGERKPDRNWIEGWWGSSRAGRFGGEINASVERTRPRPLGSHCTSWAIRALRSIMIVTTCFEVKGKGKGHPRTGHEAQRGSRGVALFFL